MPDERAPTATDVEVRIAFLHVHLLAEHVELVLLCLHIGLLQTVVESGGVDHRGPKESGEEIVATVVVLLDLLSGGRDGLEGGRRRRQRLLDQKDVEVPVWSPVDELLAVLVENLEAIAFEGNLVVEEPGDQHVHRHLALAPRCLEFLVLELDILCRLCRWRIEMHILIVHDDGQCKQRYVSDTQVHANRDVCCNVERDTTNQAKHDDAWGVRPLVRHVDTDQHLLFYA
mmetsp:Transcript_49984/g.112343  ORF Transcript_49984/g.112343 Transcript_49984/m.112343 type:complete len:229 (+) Transcript_49984:1348-2034(+)